jgi:2-polyprenyl-3-methyl-5-hydroxy-6-metoxy-1,4-benzoquinol methylase
MAQRERARELASNFIERGNQLGWFEPLYREARTNWALVQWADLAPNPHLFALDGGGKRALKIGCGLGDDAEQLAAWGFDVGAFDYRRRPLTQTEFLVRGRWRARTRIVERFHGCGDASGPPLSRGYRLLR